MKKIIIILTAIAFFACQPAEKGNFTLTGFVDGQETGMVYLQDRVAGLMIDLDSTTIENGVFILEGQMEYPQMYYLRVEGVPGRVALFMENANMEIKIEQREPINFIVSGSKSHDIYMEFNSLMEPFDENLRAMQQQLVELELADNAVEVEKVREKIAATEKDKRDQVVEFVRRYGQTTVAVFIASRNLLRGPTPKEIREVFSGFDTELKGTRYYDEFEASLLALERVDIGMPAVDFTLASVTGEEVSLSDYRGKVILISFWASWCPYCRVSNPDLVKVYDKFKDQNFEVIGVSLDRNHEAWVKGIEEDGLQWVHVSDLKGWQSGPASEYAVRSIPQNVLIDAQGIIIGRDIKYNDLEIELEALLKEV
jgi:peroxiredoxin